MSLLDFKVFALCFFTICACTPTGSSMSKKSLKADLTFPKNGSDDLITFSAAVFAAASTFMFGILYNIVLTNTIYITINYL